jgi:predicted nuclease of predicted toxin-antitoxin system
LTVVIDNCLPVSWAAFLQGLDHNARHWRELGPPNAPDTQIMAWAQQNNAVVLTHDLDVTQLLFQTNTAMPRVIQLRVDDVRPGSIGRKVAGVLAQYCEELLAGALITLKGSKTRLRILPLNPEF